MNYSRDREGSGGETSKCTQHKAYFDPKYTCNLMIDVADRSCSKSLESLRIT